MAGGLAYRHWAAPQVRQGVRASSSQVAYYDPGVHGTRIRHYEAPDGSQVIGRKAAKRAGLLLTKKQRARARREGSANA